MSKSGTVEKPSTINIKSQPIKEHIGASKFDNDDWGTIAFSFSRKDLSSKFYDEELRYNSIYFLFGYEDGHEVVYVGQALKRSNGESSLARLREHDKSKTEPYRDKWNWVIVVTNKSDTWGSTELNALESIFIWEIPDENNLNGRGQNNGGANINAYSDKVNQIKALITVIGFKVFDDIPEKESLQVTSVINEYSVVEDLQNGMARIPEIVTPDKIVKAMVDMLPEDVWNSNTKFLDPACKGGEYLREIYDRLMDNETIQSEFPNNIERSNHILKNQIFGIALSQVSLTRTTKKLFGEDRNIKIIPNYINKLKGINMGTRPDGSQNDIRDILNKEFERDMKFDVVIGNPPYQESTYSGLNESGGKALFDSFIINGVNVTDRILCMITPTKWIAGNLKTFDNVRHSLLDNRNLEKMVDYMNAKDIFVGRSIAGGVSYFLFDKEYHGDTQFTTVNGKVYTNMREFNSDDIIPRHYVGDTIIGKIKKKSTDYLSDYVYKNLWNLGTDFEGNVVRTSDKEIELITPKGESYVEFESQPKHCDTYKVAFTRVVTDHAVEPDKTFKYGILSSIRVLKPGQICNASYMVVNGINKEEYANNIKTYLETKFVRFLILQTLFGIGLTPDRFRYVPLMDFTKQWTDEELYSYYGLDNTEIEFIENIIKPITPQLKSSQAKLKLTKEDVQANYINKMVNNIQ